MRPEIKQAGDKLLTAGFTYAGLCNCASRALKYKFNGYSIKIFPSLNTAVLSFQNKRITPHEPIHKIEALIERATFSQPKSS